MRIGKEVKNSGKDRRYTVRRGARKAVEVGELERKWNDGEITKNGHTKLNMNSWEYIVKMILPEHGNQAISYELEAVNADHAVGRALAMANNEMWSGQIPPTSRYWVTEVVRLSHRMGSHLRSTENSGE